MGILGRQFDKKLSFFADDFQSLIYSTSRISSPYGSLWLYIFNPMHLLWATLKVLLLRLMNVLSYAISIIQKIWIKNWSDKMGGGGAQWNRLAENSCHDRAAVLKAAENCEQMTVNSSLCLSGLSLRARSQVYKHFKLWEKKNRN